MTDAKNEADSGARSDAVLGRAVALALFLLSLAGFAALLYANATTLHGPSVMVGLLMAVCVGSFGAMLAPNSARWPNGA